MSDIVKARPIRCGDKVTRDAATHNQGKVQLGDGAPVFAPASIRAGDKVTRDAATHNQGKVQLGDGAPVFGR
jgi:CRISPR/Cas system CMR subunit Cmr4 (Cas7 group RAMP superfamily)